MNNKKKIVSKLVVTTDVEGYKFNKKVYLESGVFILRDFIPIKVIKKLQFEWNEYMDVISSNGLLKDNNNSVNFINKLPENFENFWKSKWVKKISNRVFGKNTALYNHRVVRKEPESDFEVFLHQDYCYHVGLPDKCSLFIPLFDCGIKEGGMSFYLGSHQCGYLGDAGEIDASKFDKWEILTPQLKIGDVVIMNSLTWHKSGPNKTKADRVLFDIIIQPSNDPSGTELISGEWLTDFWIQQRKNKNFLTEDLFINCRAKKIKKLC